MVVSGHFTITVAISITISIYFHLLFSISSKISPIIATIIIIRVPIILKIMLVKVYLRVTFIPKHFDDALMKINTKTSLKLLLPVHPVHAVASNQGVITSSMSGNARARSQYKGWFPPDFLTECSSSSKFAELGFTNES